MNKNNIYWRSSTKEFLMQQHTHTSTGKHVFIVHQAFAILCHCKLDFYLSFFYFILHLSYPRIFCASDSSVDKLIHLWTAVSLISFIERVNCTLNTYSDPKLCIFIIIMNLYTITTSINWKHQMTSMSTTYNNAKHANSIYPILREKISDISIGRRQLCLAYLCLQH